MRIFGGILPFIGFRRVKVSCDDASDMGISNTRLVEGSFDEVWIEALEVEWFGVGLTLTARGVSA